MKTAKELAMQMLDECDATGSADYDTISIVREDDGTYSIGDNGEGADELSREAALQCLTDDIAGSVSWRQETAANTIILNESGFDTGMTFANYCALAAEHGDNPSDYGDNIEEFTFVSVDYARNDPAWDVPEGWPADLPLWEYRPSN